MKNNENLNKRLTNPYIKDILYFLTRENNPITSTKLIEILDQNGKTTYHPNYTYEQLKFLYPEKFEFNKRTIILDLRKLKNNPSRNYLGILINKLLDIFGIKKVEIKRNNKEEESINIKLNWLNGIDEEGIKFRYLLLNDWKFTYYTSLRKIIIRNCLTFNQFIIEWNSLEDEQHESGLIQFFFNYHRDLLIKKKLRLKYDLQDNVHIHLEKINKGKNTKFVDVFLKEKVRFQNVELRMLYKNLISEGNRLEDVRRKFFNVFHYPFIKVTSNEMKNRLYNIINNSRYWKYQINLKGFFLYLYLENMEMEPIEEIYGKRYKQKHRIKDKNTKLKENQYLEDPNRKMLSIKNKKQDIQGLLSNSLILKLCPFLEFNKEFQEKGFRSEQVLLDLSKEIVPQIDYYERGIYRLYSGVPVLSYEEFLEFDDKNESYQNNYMLWKIWERYYYEIEKYFIKTFHIENEIPFVLAIKRNFEIYEKLLKYRLRTSVYLQKMINLEINSLTTLYEKAYDDCKEWKSVNTNTFPSPTEFKENFILMTHRYLVISSFLQAILFHHQNL